MLLLFHLSQNLCLFIYYTLLHPTTEKGGIVEEKQRYKRKENFTQYALKLQARSQTNLHPQGLHIVVTTHNCSISSKFIPQATPQATPPHKPSPLSPIIHHSPYLLNIQTFFSSLSLNEFISSMVDLPNYCPHTSFYLSYHSPFY